MIDIDKINCLLRETPEEIAIRVIPSEANHYTGYMLEELIECYDYINSISSNNYQNGNIFERIVQQYLILKYGFQIFSEEDCKRSYGEFDMFGKTSPSRILQKNVVMRTMEDVINENYGRVTGKKRTSKTEFVLNILNPLATEEFSKTCFDADGALRIRVECKTQTRTGSIDKKIPGCINELKYCSDQTNIIFLMSGTYYSDYHYMEAEFYGSNSWSNSQCQIPQTNIRVMNEKDFAEWCQAAMGKND
jgi:hypothetical protein